MRKVIFFTLSIFFTISSYAWTKAEIDNLNKLSRKSNFRYSLNTNQGYYWQGDDTCVVINRDKEVCRFKALNNSTQDIHYTNGTILESYYFGDTITKYCIRDTSGKVIVDDDKYDIIEYMSDTLFIGQEHFIEDGTPFFYFSVINNKGEQIIDKIKAKPFPIEQWQMKMLGDNLVRITNGADFGKNLIKVINLKTKEETICDYADVSGTEYTERVVAKKTEFIKIVPKDSAYGVILDLDLNIVCSNFEGRKRGLNVYKNSKDMVRISNSIYKNNKLLFKSSELSTPHYLHNKFLVREKDGRFKLFDINGVETDHVAVSDNVIWYLADNKWTLKNKNGKIISPEFNYVRLKHDCGDADGVSITEGEHTEEYFSVSKDKKGGVIDAKGNWILPLDDYVCEISYNAIRAFKKEGNTHKFTFFDFKGNMLYPFALERDEGYRSTSMFDQGSVDFGGKSEDCPFDGYMLNGKWGLLDKVTKKLIIPFCLDGLSEYRNGLGKVLYKGKLYFINHKGEGLPSEAYIGVDEFVNYKEKGKRK